MFRVYVIELGHNCPPCQTAAAGRSLYVGQTWHSPEVRLQQHLQGNPAGRNHVKRCGGQLRRDLYEELPSLATREEAEKAEAALARRLRKRGYRVYGGH